MKEKILCALCSYGMSGRVFHAPLIASHSGLELYSVLERSAKRCNAIYPQVKSVQLFDELINDQASELVIINIPDHLHYEFARAALMSGKHVVVEKPFTIDLHSAVKLRQLAEEKNLQIFVFQNRRWDSDFLTIKELIHSGRLGRIVEFEAHFDRFRPIPPTNTWKEDEKLGTGLLYNLGAHLIDQAIVLFGLPDAVYADIAVVRPDSKINDYFTLILFYNQMRVILRSSYVVKESPAKYMIHGDKGSFIKNGQDPQEERLNAGWKADAPGLGEEDPDHYGKLFLDDSDNEYPEIIKSTAGNYMNFYNDVYKSLRTDFKGAVTANDGISVMQVIDAAVRSNEKGYKINLSEI